MQADFTLEEAKKIQQKEAVRVHTQQLHTTDHKCVEEVRHPKPQRSKNVYSQHNRYTHRDARDKRGVQTNHNCGRCGQIKHRPGDVQPNKQFAENAIRKVTMLHAVFPKQLQPLHMK